MRGEDAVKPQDRLIRAGSPPHARGRPAVETPGQVWARITPACAGKTPPPAASARPSPDHPRMRGEDCRRTTDVASPAGSPPHARGRLDCGVDLRGRDRITPACAGKTPFVHYALSLSPDHPRMRGEDLYIWLTMLFTEGSPPHARGRQAGIRLGWRLLRITPACAGKTRSTRLTLTTWWDHPRMRGEDHTGTSTSVSSFGSPPHARGRPFYELAFDDTDRITPACAGKTSLQA